MKLTISEAADLLDVDEKTVFRWIEERRLPAERMAGQFRMNRSALLEWATENRVTVSPRIFQIVDGDADPLPPVSSALARGGVHHAVKGSTREDVLREVVRLLALPAEADSGDLLAVLLAREGAGGTGIGDGIAIPHVRAPIVLDVEEPIVSVSFLSEPVDFGAADGKPVKVLFTIVTPTVRTHLHILSRVAYLLKDPRFREAVQAEASAEVLLARAADVEAEIAGGKRGAPRA